MRPEDLPDEGRVTYERILEIISTGGLEALNRELATLPEFAQDLVRRAWASPPPGIDDRVVDDVLLRMKRETLQNRARDIANRLAAAEHRGDGQEVAILMAEHGEVSRALDAMKRRRRGGAELQVARSGGN